MKLRIFKGTNQNGKEYWSLTAKNYKDSNDKCTIYVNFTKDAGEPNTLNGESYGKFYQYADIDVLEMKFGCYKGKPQISIFKWVHDCTPTQEDYDRVSDKSDKNVFGANPKIQPDDLPFF